MVNRIGLIAGNGRFPIILAESARKKGVEIIAIGINEETSKELEKFVNKIYWLGAGELENLLKILKQENIRSIVMAGQVKHKLLFDKNIKIDPKMQFLLGSLKDKKTDSIIGAVAKLLEFKGIKVLSSIIFLSDYLPQKGVLTKQLPDKRILKDIEFGRKIAKAIAGLDLGQSVIVKDQIALAVESIEGTDEAIRRAARYGKDGIVVIKVTKPRQDMRFDVPVIGPDTIKVLQEVRAGCIAIEAKKTLIIDKEETIKLADEAGIVIVAV
ncbi:MAG: UDP-2,3-diacylglucosamine diphosphatase LpxI [Candidatus Omnitrophota bacterium]|nr:UDP-2,3-diacylglucosamine diphosphatase LpxI [Candidatus Omnitrophota bacterium]